jgi:hypothetical protein
MDRERAALARAMRSSATRKLPPAFIAWMALLHRFITT